MVMTQVFHASGNTAEFVERIFTERNPDRILIVTGKNLYSQSGAKENLSGILEKLDVEIFQYVKSNPTLEDITACVERARSHRSQVIVGLGGGTAMDIAKATRAFVPHLGNFRDYIFKKIPFEHQSIQTLVQIPTTAGTGSEITQFAVVYVDGVKYSLDNPLLKADYCILDPMLTMSMPPQLTAVTALDALSQAIESFWSVNSTDESMKYSLDAIRLIAPRIERLSDILPLNDREALLKASHLSGLAISVTRTTAAHAISYSLTSKYGVPHGLAVALTIPIFFRYNYELDDSSNQDSRGVKFVKSQIELLANTLGHDDVKECSEWLTTSMNALDLSTRLREYGVMKDAIEGIVASFNEERGKNNPRKVTQEDLVELLKEIW